MLYLVFRSYSTADLKEEVAMSDPLMIFETLARHFGCSAEPEVLFPIAREKYNGTPPNEWRKEFDLNLWNEKKELPDAILGLFGSL